MLMERIGEDGERRERTELVALMYRVAQVCWDGGNVAACEVVSDAAEKLELMWDIRAEDLAQWGTSKPLKPLAPFSPGSKGMEHWPEGA